MVKLKGALLSESAHGSIAKTLTFSKRQSGQQARKFNYPKKPISQTQYTQRTIIGLLTAHWQVMSSGEKATWNEKAKSTGFNMSGFNYFIKKANGNLLLYHGLAAYWSFNELTGAIVYDYSGQDNHGTLGPTYPGNAPLRVNSINEKFGKALLFDGAQRVATTFKPEDNLPTDFTMLFWLKRNAFVDRGHFIGAASVAPRFYWRESKTTEIAVGLGDDSGVFGHNMSLGVWYFIAWTFKDNPELLTHYIDAKWKQARPMGSGAKRNVNMLIGSSVSIDGYLDEMRFYNRTLTQPEIQKQYELLRMDKKRQPLLRR